MRTDRPLTLKEIIARINARLGALEARRPSVGVAHWTLSEDASGNLVATDPDGVATTLATR